LDGLKRRSFKILITLAVVLVWNVVTRYISPHRPLVLQLSGMGEETSWY
jgi:hypothetical protein